MLKKAIQYMLISTLAFAALNSFVKELKVFNVYQIVFFRAIGSIVFTMFFLIKNNISVYGNRKGLLILRGVVGLTSMSLFFASIKYLPIGSAVSLRYISPIFAAFFAVWILKERIKNVQWIYFAIAFAGVIVLKGFDKQINLIGLALVLGSAVFSGLVYIIIRKIGNRDHPVVIVNYFMVISALVGGVLCINNWVDPSGVKEWSMLLSLGVFGYFAQFYMTKAFQEAETNQVAPLKYIEVIFTMVVGLLWFEESYTVWSILGILLIILGLTLNVSTKKK